MARVSGRTWIFVSHASEDLPAVREVRNYLEGLDTSPLLFHLLALKYESEFWPVIEREIMERDFFLICESRAAARSEWVQRERAAVEHAASVKPKRIGRIRVDGPSLDLRALDGFVAATRVYPSYTKRDLDAVQPFLVNLQKRGFEVFENIKNLEPATDWATELMSAISSAAARGFIVVFLSKQSLDSTWVQMEIEYAIEHNVRLVPVIIDSTLALSSLPRALRQQVVDATLHPSAAPDELADLLYSFPI